MAATVSVPLWPSAAPTLYPARPKASWARRTTSAATTFTVGRTAARLPAGVPELACAPDLRALPRAGCFLRGAGAGAFCAAIVAQQDPRSPDLSLPTFFTRQITFAS